MLEYKVYQLLHGSSGFPHVYGWGKEVRRQRAATSLPVKLMRTRTSHRKLTPAPGTT